MQPAHAPIGGPQYGPQYGPQDTPQAILCDLDGCLIAGGRLLPGAAELAALAGERLWIVSNNSSDTEETLAAALRAVGFPAVEARILLAGALAVDRLAAGMPGADVLVRATPALHARATARGLSLGGPQPRAVLVCRDPAFDLAALAEVTAALHGGARLVVANPDGAHPGPDGCPVPETGAWLAAIRAVLPGIEAEVVGKPGPALFEAALARAGVVADRALFIGDNPETDGAGARAIGLPVRIVAPGGLPGLVRDLAEATR